MRGVYVMWHVYQVRNTKKLDPLRLLAPRAHSGIRGYGNTPPHARLPRRRSRVAEEGAASALALQLRVDLETEATVKSKLNTCGQGVAARGVKVGGGSWRGVQHADAAHKCGYGGQLLLQGWCRAVRVGCMHAWLAYAARAGVQLVISGSRAGRRLCARGRPHLNFDGGRDLDEALSQPPR